MFAVATSANNLIVGSYLSIVGAAFVGTKVQTGINSLLAAHRQPPQQVVRIGIIPQNNSIVKGH